MSGAQLTSGMLGRLSIALGALVCGYAAANSLSIREPVTQPVPAQEIAVAPAHNPFGRLEIDVKPRGAGGVISMRSPFEELRDAYFGRMLHAATEVEQVSPPPVSQNLERRSLPIGCEPLGAVSSWLGHVPGRCLS